MSKKVNIDHMGRQDYLHFHWLKDPASGEYHIFYEPVLVSSVQYRSSHTRSPTATIACTYYNYWFIIFVPTQRVHHYHDSATVPSPAVSSLP